MNTHTIKTAVIALSAILCSAAVPLFAEDDGLRPYAQIRFYSGLVSQDRDMSTTSAVKGKNDTQILMKSTDARFGMKGRKGDLEGVAEFGFGKDGQSTSTDVKDTSGTKVGSFSLSNTYMTTRHIYAIWHAGQADVLFGQTEAPYAFYSSCATDNNANKAFGSTHQNRDVQLKVSSHGAYFALLNTDIAPASGGSLPSSVSASSTAVIIPKMALGYEYSFKSDAFELSAGPGIAGQSFKIDRKTSTSATKPEVILNGERITSFLAYTHGKLRSGGFSVSGNVGYGINTSNMGLRYDSQGFTSSSSSLCTKLPSGYITAAAAVDPHDASKLKNAKSFEGFIDAGYDFGPVEFRGGFGGASVTSYVTGSEKTRIQQQYFAQCSIPLIAKKLWFKPEFAYRDYGALGSKSQGSEWLAGIYVQANVD